MNIVSDIRFQTHPELTKPFLSLIGFLLTKSEVDLFSLFLLERREGNHMLAHISKVLNSIRVFACAQTL